MIGKMGRGVFSAYPQQYGGPGDNFDEKAGHVVASLMRRFHEAKTKKRGSLRLWGTGLPRREFIHVDDVADASVHLCSVPPGRLLSPINVGVGKDESIAELAAQVKRVVGFEGKMVWDPSKPGGAPRKWLDSQRLFDTGWKPKIPLEKGLRETYRFFRTHVAPS
ncbi:MAG: NAD-dependent epimerase/dehydratase family protein [Elusimicrobia bacterium]|nr:NAD-dependent epimerase/dehydratase family protein [Elusimicrobiota bacterium]